MVPEIPLKIGNCKHILAASLMSSYALLNQRHQLANLPDYRLKIAIRFEGIQDRVNTNLTLVADSKR